MSTARSNLSVTLEAFLARDPEPGTRLEWCAGMVYAMSGGSPEHARLAARVIATFAAFEGDDCTVFGSTADIWVEAAQFYGQADVSLVCGALHTHVVKKHGVVLGEAITNPVVLVEVLSPSTEARDRGEKFENYKLIASLREVLLVAQGERRIEVRRRTDDGWSNEIVADAGETIVHGRALSLDAIYGERS